MLDQVADTQCPERNRWKTMIIDYDKNPSLTVDQKLQSLIESIQRMSDEITDSIEDLKKRIKEMESES